MSERFDLLAQQLLGQPDVAACSLDEVRRLAERHPYYAPAQFLLLRKLKETGEDEYRSVLQRAVLYYPDPLAFEYLLHSDHLRSSWEAPLPVAETETVRSEPSVDQEENEPVKEAGESALVAETPVSSAFQPEAGNVDLQTAAVMESMAEGPETSVQPEEPALPRVELPRMDAPPVEQPLAFEPYHTVDYFASQGIKLSIEQASNDKFGKQLKSFTEWLRDMKRLPATQVAQQVDAGSEHKVVRLAEGSVHDSQVVTEAMAEVWLKQGNNEKAAEVYRKLSLLNPSKKAYFAAKLEHLKRS